MRASAEPARSLPVSDPAAAAMTGALCSSGDGLLAASVRLVRCCVFSFCVCALVLLLPFLLRVWVWVWFPLRTEWSRGAVGIGGCVQVLRVPL